MSPDSDISFIFTPGAQDLQLEKHIYSTFKSHNPLLPLQRLRRALRRCVSLWFKLNHHYVKCFTKFSKVKSGNFNFSSYRRKTSVEKMPRIRKWKLYFHVSNLEWAQQEGEGSLWFIFKWEVYRGNWISLSFQRMNFLVADRIVSSGGVNIQLWASGAILHYRDSQELSHLPATQRSDNFHFCFTVQTIPPRPLKTFFTRFNLHLKGDNISKEFCFKFKRKLVSALRPLCQPGGLILYLKASQPQEHPFVGVIEFSVFVHR